MFYNKVEKMNIYILWLFIFTQADGEELQTYPGHWRHLLHVDSDVDLRRLFQPGGGHSDKATTSTGQ